MGTYCRGSKQGLKKDSMSRYVAIFPVDSKMAYSIDNDNTTVLNLEKEAVCMAIVRLIPPPDLIL